MYIIQVSHIFKNTNVQFVCLMSLEWSVHVAESEQERVIETESKNSEDDEGWENKWSEGSLTQITQDSGQKS